jgi:hypothetical protein
MCSTRDLKQRTHHGREGITMSEYKGDDAAFYLQLYTEAATLFANAKKLDRRFAAALSLLFKPIHNCVFAALPPTHASTTSFTSA